MTDTSPSELDVLTVGRISVDLYPEQSNVPLSGVETFRKSIGGTATNVAVAAARLGRRAAVFTKVGDDGFGEYVRLALERFGVDTTYVGTDPDHRTPLAFAVLDPPEEPDILFYRQPKGPDESILVTDVDLDVVRSVPILWVAGSRVAFEPSRATVTELLEIRARRPHTVIDLDYRPMFWSDPAEASRRIAPLLDHVTVAVGNRTECEIAVGTADPHEAATRLLDHGIELAIVKMGADGVLAASADGLVEVKPEQVEVVCGLGAGDAFGGALCHGLLEGWDPETLLRHANAAGAIVAGRLMCADDMPTLAEVEALAGVEERS